MTPRQGKSAIFEQFAADGFTYMFGNPGTVEQGFLDVLEETDGIDYVLALQETVALGIADGYARASGGPALVQLHSGVGLGNGIGMLYQAKRGHSPLVVLVGEAGLAYDSMDAQMATDLVAMAKPVTKYAGRVVHPDSVLRVLRRAVKIAMTPPRGPVLVVLPMDVLDADTAEPVIASTVPSRRAIPVPDEIDRAADVLAQGRHPVLLIGDGVTVSGAQDEVVAVAEMLGADVWGVESSEVNMDAAHPLYRGTTGHMFGPVSAAAVEHADVVLIVGTYVFPDVFPSLESPFAVGSRVVHIDVDDYEIAKNFPVEVALVADPKGALAALATRLSERAIRSERVIGAAGAPDYQYTQPVPPGPGAPMIEQFAAELARQAGPEVVIFDESLTASPSLLRQLPPRVPGTYFSTRGGSLGVGLPGAVGIKMARPDAEVVGFAGDGGSMYTYQALWTAVRYDVAARFVICNNGRYGVLDANLGEYWRERDIPAHDLPGSFGLADPAIDFTALAKALGADAERVEKPEEIEPAVRRMLASPAPYLIDLATE